MTGSAAVRGMCCAVLAAWVSAAPFAVAEASAAAVSVDAAANTAAVGGGGEQAAALEAERAADEALFNFLERARESPTDSLTPCNAKAMVKHIKVVRSACASLSPGVRALSKGGWEHLKKCMAAVQDAYGEIFSACVVDPRYVEVHEEDGPEDEANAAHGLPQDGDLSKLPRDLALAYDLNKEVEALSSDTEASVKEGGAVGRWAGGFAICDPKQPLDASVRLASTRAAQHIEGADGFARPHPVRSFNAFVQGLQPRMAGAASEILDVPLIWRTTDCTPLGDY